LLLNLEAAVGELVEQGDNGLQKVLIASQRIDNGPFREHSGAKKSMKSDVFREKWLAFAFTLWSFYISSCEYPEG
jgi:hypothetical protein